MNNYKKKSTKKPYPEPIEGVTYREVMHMDMEELLSRLPKYKEADIKYLISKRVIRCFPLKSLDYEVLKRLHNVWGTVSIVQINAKHLKKSQRKAILDKTDKGINTKLEAWLYTKIKKFLDKGEGKIPRRNIRLEVIKRFNIKISKQKNEELKKLINRITKRIVRERRQNGFVKKEHGQNGFVK